MILHWSLSLFFFFFNDTATTEIYTLSLHDALPISRDAAVHGIELPPERVEALLQHGLVHDAFFDEGDAAFGEGLVERSEEHTFELQSRLHLVCRLLLEKKKTNRNRATLTALPHRTV